MNGKLRNASALVFLGILAIAIFAAGYVTGDKSGTVSDSYAVVTEAQAAGSDAQMEWSRTEPYPRHDVYYPGTETLGPDEMRVIACGTGMPTPRLKQAAGCFLVELGNWE